MVKEYLDNFFVYLIPIGQLQMKLAIIAAFVLLKNVIAIKPYSRLFSSSRQIQMSSVHNGIIIGAGRIGNLLWVDTITLYLLYLFLLLSLIRI